MWSCFKVLVVAAVLASASFVTPSVSLAQSAELETTPRSPSWVDTVTVTATGNACAPIELTFVSAEEREVVMRLTTFCGLADPPFFADYEFQLVLPRLEPGEWDLVLIDDREPSNELARSTVFIHNLGNIAIDAALDPERPGLVTVRAFGYSCAERFDPVGDLSDIVLEGVGSCYPSGIPVFAEFFEIQEVFSVPPGLRRFSVTSMITASYREVATTTVEVPQPPPPSLCVPSTSVLCLGFGGRFQASLILDGRDGRAVQLEAPGATRSSTGLFSVFDDDNIEVTVKVLDGCTITDHFWVFASWNTTLAARLEVVDLESGARAVYGKDGDTLALPVADVRALPCR